MSTKFDIYQAVTDRIIAQLEKGVIPWHKPWKVTGAAIRGAEDLRKVAFNRVTKTAYSALNQMLLTRTGEYASFKQWTEAGGKIKKGAKSEIVVFWKWLDILDEKDRDENGNPKKKKIPFLKYLQVFHIDDVEGVKPLDLNNVTEASEQQFNSDEEAERIITTYSEREKVSITYYGNAAFYRPASDEIYLPERFKFGKVGAEFYSTAFHEITHSTGAACRLDRIKPALFGSTDYSKEELVAEIGACGLCNLLNIETAKSFENSAAYIQSWIKKLRNDNKMIVMASAKAEKAIRYILNGKEETEAA
jgi:antirestriction protein ArdC